MSGNDENAIRPQNLQGGLRVGTIKFVSEIGQNRRALSTINTNLVAPAAYPAAVNKRGLSEKHEISEKNPLFPVHRPVTRKYAAQMANKQSCSDYPAKDGETASDLSVLMNHTESVLNDMEFEMEDIGVEPSMDIDVCDLKNPLAVVEYVEEIYSFYRKAESSSCVSPTYMSQQIDINEKMRAILIDWLIEVHYKFELMDETLFLTVNLIDRFLACQSIVRKKLQLVGITAMLLACKYEEVSVPVVEDLILISDKAYTRKEVLDMERLMVNKLQFNMSVPTPYVFMRRFLKASQFDKKLELLSFFMMELCLVEYKMLKYPPSLLAAAAIYTAQCTLDGSKKWSKTSEWYSTYSEDELLECSRLMVAFHQKAGAGKLTGVHRKYNTFKFGYAAKSEPAEFLLEKKL